MRAADSKKAPAGLAGKPLRGVAGVALLVLAGLAILVSGFLPFPWDLGGCAVALMPFYLGASLALEHWSATRP
ncbi:MAG: hypothetical protein OXU61_11445 [Gammaproteobacteria bacterium]|nr:hypothetical protein [Gammaproteobacteria bacterium]MDD9824208.1 hypothetical protein [Gammaproteobacteria bacterium]MDD9863269.1 hypothetical protein [Gammaproteobacteria bacterium]